MRSLRSDPKGLLARKEEERVTLHKSGHNTHTRTYGKKTWSVKNLGRKFIITANTVQGASRVLDNMCTHGGGRNPLSLSLPPPPPPRYPQERGRRVVRVGRSSHSSFFPCAKPFCFYLLLLLFLLRRRITHAWLGPSPFPPPFPAWLPPPPCPHLVNTAAAAAFGGGGGD